MQVGFAGSLHISAARQSCLLTICRAFPVCFARVSYNRELLCKGYTMISSRLAQACEAPASPWMPLRIASQACGWMHPRVLTCLQEAGCELAQSGEGVEILPALGSESPSSAHDAVSAWLSHAARAMRVAG